MEFGLLFLRIVLASLLAGHALQKLLGWFHGKGVRGTAAVFDGWGFKPGVLMVIAASAAELTGALLFSVGFLTPLASAVVAGAMIVASSPNFNKGLWGQRGGYEVPFTYAIIAIALAMTGPGSLSLDAALGLDLHGWAWGLAAVGVAVIVSGPMLLLRKHHLRAAAAVLTQPDPQQ